MWNSETVIPYDGCGPKIGKVKKQVDIYCLLQKWTLHWDCTLKIT